MKLLNYIWQQLGDFKRFLLCLLEDNCVYSIKKFLAYIFSGVAIYCVVYDKTNSLVEILLFVTALLGMRVYERQNNKTDNKSDNIT